MTNRTRNRQALLLGGAAAFAIGLIAPAHAEENAKFRIPPQSLDTALAEFGVQSGHTVLAGSYLTDTKKSRGFSAAADPDTALRRVLDGTGLSYRRDGDVFVIVQAEARRAPRPVSAVIAAETVTGSAIEGLTVTAQKRREAIQDVPIAISAFSADALQAQKIEGGFDLLKAIPNVTFSKTNFSGYNFTIRGIGTKGISVATDPGVAVEFNDTPLIRNRLFEQEYFDVERVEVLRGPQGTLHGRNATAGVINVISNTADLDAFDGSLRGEVGNFHTKRLSGFVNVPLIEDVLAVRFAGALTNREGYDFNATTDHAINGRDLWSGRLSIGFEPTSGIRADFMWERFNEDDNRSRTGKQLCHRDAGPEAIGAQTGLGEITRAFLSQGCKAGNLYDDAAFGTPNGLSIPFILAGGLIPLGYTAPVSNIPERDPYVAPLLAWTDPYGGMMQSRDLRTVNSIKDPIYRAKTDVFELNVDWDISSNLTLTSQTAYVDDQIYSFQDYNRFNTVPIFPDTSALWELDRDPNTFAEIDVPSPYRDLMPGGIYCDPQLGCSNSIAGFDISQAKSEQFSQEIRVQSDYDGPFNFNVGANYMRYSTLEDYYVMFNLITLAAQSPGLLNTFNGSVDPTKCLPKGSGGQPLDNSPSTPRVPIGDPGTAGCVYIDPHPFDQIDGEGHNYFRSKNPYHLSSWAGFGEVYWQSNDALKFTLGLRYTRDEKNFTPVPTQLLLASSALLGGTVDRGYPAEPNIIQKWGEWTGRLGVDWKPDLSFTDETMVYAFISRGYKGGGANPPGIGYTDTNPFNPDGPPLLQTLAYPETFEPEFINAFEVGTKNTMLGGGLTLNTTAFYYDYKDYQVSQIKERTAVNENFDATVWGLEFESIFAPTQDLRFNASLGYQDTDIADGEESLDLMDRTQSDPSLTLMKPWLQLPSNCVIPTAGLEQLIADNRASNSTEFSLFVLQCGGFLGQPLNPRNAPNGGQGLYAQLGGNELPNAPHFTVSIGGEYSWDLLDGDWTATVRADGYWQSQSWARVYNNDPYDKLHGWYNANLSMWIEKPEEDLKIEFYVKNLLDDTPITDAFLNSDDTALTTNVFVLDPRLIGLSITKGF